MYLRSGASTTNAHPSEKCLVQRSAEKLPLSQPHHHRKQEATTSEARTISYTDERNSPDNLLATNCNAIYVPQPPILGLTSKTAGADHQPKVV